MELKTKHYRCINMMVYTDMTYLEIAKELNINNNTITNWLKDDVFRAELDSEVRKKFSRLAVKAQKKLESLIDSQSEKVSLGAVKEVLSKAGFDAVQKVESTNTNIEITVED